MRDDPVLVSNTRAWLEKAAKDLERAESCLGGERSDPEDALFHCQQAVEKALKGFLTWHDRPFRKTHDIEILVRQCAEVDAGLQHLGSRASRLTEYAWLYRYPGDAPTAELGHDAEQARSLATEVLQEVLRRLPPEVHPKGQVSRGQ